MRPDTLAADGDTVVVTFDLDLPNHIRSRSTKASSALTKPPSVTDFVVATVVAAATPFSQTVAPGQTHKPVHRYPWTRPCPLGRCVINVGIQDQPVPIVRFELPVV